MICYKHWNLLFIFLLCLNFKLSCYKLKKQEMFDFQNELTDKQQTPTSFNPGLSFKQFSPVAEQAFNFFYPGQISNAELYFPYLQTFSTNQNNPTFVCYDPIILLIMYYTQQNDIANLIKILQTNNFSTKGNFINTYQLTGQYLNTLYRWNFRNMPIESKLDSWIYAGSANEANTVDLYPILILGQSNIAMQILLENGASPNFLGYAPVISPYQGYEYEWQFKPFRCNSALLYAIQQNNLDTATILLSYGADPNIQDTPNASTSAFYDSLYGKTPNINPTTPYLYAINTEGTSPDMIALLKKFGGGQSFSSQATSSLQEAIKSADIRTIQNLLAQNVNINTPIIFENEEMSILQYIILQPDSYPKYDVINTLFNANKGVVINQQSSISKTTPLMAAVCIKDNGKPATCSNCTGVTEMEAIIELLMKNGADPFRANSNNISPYQVISAKLNTMDKSNPKYNSLTQKLLLLVNNMNYVLLTIGYYLYNLSLISLAENLNTNLVNVQSRNILAVVNTAQYQNLVANDKPTLENIITIIKSFPAKGDWGSMHAEAEILNTIISNYMKLGGSLGAQYEGNTILTAAQSTHNENLVNWIKRNFGKTLEFIDAINTNNLTQISASLNSGIPVDTLINADGDTALIYACSTENIDLVNLLLKAKANINLKNTLGQTPLYIAVLKNNIELAQILITQNADVNFIDKSGNSLLMQACSTNKIKLATLLLKAKANQNFENSSGQTPLSISALNNNYDLAQLILSYNANINYKNKQGQTLLSQCILANNMNCLNFLIKNKANINLPINANNDTALIYACLNKNTNLATILLNAGVNINIANNSGQTALSIAIQNNNYNLTQLLSQHGADFNFKNQSGESALVECINNTNLEFVNLLISNKGDVNIPINSNKDTALIYACNQNNNNLINILLKANANPNIANNSGDTPLFIAINNNNNNLINILLTAKANPNAQNNSGAIPLLIAINTNNYTLAELLIKNGADVNLIYNSANGPATLLTEFIMNKNITAIKFLIHHKANINTVGINGKTPTQCYANECDPYQVRWEKEAGRSDPFCFDNELKTMLYNQNTVNQEEEMGSMEEEPEMPHFKRGRLRGNFEEMDPMVF